MHDAQRDQRELYKAIREQLDQLPDTPLKPQAAQQLDRVDENLQQLHHTLTQQYATLMQMPDAATVSFHELMGQWLHLPSFKVEFDPASLQSVHLEELDRHAQEVGDILERAESASYPANPWVKATDIALPRFLSTPMEQFRAQMEKCVQCSIELDGTRHPTIPLFAADLDLSAQGVSRLDLAERLSQTIASVDPAIRAKWANVEAATIRRERQKLADLSASLEIVRGGPLNGELAPLVRTQLPALSVVVQQIGALAAYLSIARRWYLLLAFRRKAAAAKVLAQYGLTLAPEHAERLHTFLTGLRARLLVQGCPW